MSFSIDELMKDHIKLHYVPTEAPEKPDDSDNMVMDRGSIHSHGFERFGLPEFCINVDNFKPEDATLMTNSICSLYYDFITKSEPIHINQVHVFDNVILSDGELFAFRFLPVVCFDVSCLLVVRVSSKEEDHGRIINDIDYYVNHDKWTGTSIKTNIYSRLNVADLYGVTFTEPLDYLVYNTMLVKYLTDTDKSYHLGS